MHDGRELESASSHGRARASSEARLVHHAPGCVDVELLPGEPEEQLQRRVAKRLRQDVTDPLRWRAPGSKLVEETLDLAQPFERARSKRLSTIRWTRDRNGPKASATASVAAAVGSVDPGPIATPRDSETAANVAARPAVSTA